MRGEGVGWLMGGCCGREEGGKGVLVGRADGWSCGVGWRQWVLYRYGGVE